MDAIVRGIGEEKPLLPTHSQARKDLPVASGVLDYFPAALVEVARVSFEGNKKHNPGQPLHWSRGKSNDHADAIARHLLERGTVDSTLNLRHSAQLAWRALALLQQELEDAGLASISRGSIPSPVREPYGFGDLIQRPMKLELKPR